jgi:putative spermidine/putrescine transport system ATP-binding protein
MTAAENIGFPLKMQGISRKERSIVIKELLEKVQLAGFEQRRAAEMSGGQLQRVALARALAAKPNALLLDEPFSSLDEALRQDMRKLVLELQKSYRLTTILVTHDKQEALRMSSKVAFMTGGEILQYDMPENIYQAPASRVVAEFFCDGTCLDGTVESGVFSCDLFSCYTDHADGRYTAFIRPSAVRLADSLDFGDRSALGCFRVMEVNYCGEVYEVVLSKPGMETKLCTFISKSHRKKIEKEAEVALNLDQIIFLKG